MLEGRFVKQDEITVGTIVCPIGECNVARHVKFASIGVDKFDNAVVHGNDSVQSLITMKKGQCE